MKQQPTAEDWIILRLLMLRVKECPPLVAYTATGVRTILFLQNKLGVDKLYDMIDAIHGEGK
jgi:hypothetical protein